MRFPPGVSGVADSKKICLSSALGDGQYSSSLLVFSSLTAEPTTNGALEPLPVDQALIARLKATYTQVRGQDIRLAELFYARLFAAAPHLRSLFRGDIAAQARKLIASLDAVVDGLDRPIESAAMLCELGKRHAAYGARPEHYAMVSYLLIESMRELLGPSADQKGLAEWRLALMLISRQMVAAATNAAER